MYLVLENLKISSEKKSKVVTKLKAKYELDLLRLKCNIIGAAADAITS